MLLSSTDPKPYAKFIVQHLLRRLPSSAGNARAISETEIPFCGDDWFWADDNAKVLELLALPEVWRMWPDEISDILKFVRSLCDGPFIFRRIGSPRLMLTSRADGVAEFVHTFMNINCDLAKGQVSLGMRFHDGRSARNVIMTGNYVRFCYRGKVFTLDVENAITHHDIQINGNIAKLIWTAALEFHSRPFSRSKRRLGTLTYTCTISAESMFFDLKAALHLEDDLEISDVVLTFGYDNISHADNNVRYENIRVSFPASSALKVAVEGQESLKLPVEGANYWCIAQKSQISGFALAVHSLPKEPSRLHSIIATCNEPGQLHWLVSEHKFSGSHRGGTLEAAERKTITAGGFYDEPDIYAETLGRHSKLADAGAPPVDFSISYDYGAEVNAFARCFGVLSSESPPIDDPALRDALHGMVDHFRKVYHVYFIQAFQENTSAIFSRSIAFMAFAYAEMLGASRDPVYDEALREACDIIMSFERENVGVDGSSQSGFVMGQELGSLPHVDCHSACLLALVRASEVLNESKWLESIDRGLAAFRIDTVKILFELQFHKEDLVGVDYERSGEVRQTLNAFWSFSAGLTLRLFNALRSAQNSGLQEVWSRHAPRINMMEYLIRDRLARSLRFGDEEIEIRTSVLSGETNSETQPWAALGLIGRH